MTISARVVIVSSSSSTTHPRWPIAERCPQCPEDRDSIALVRARHLPEDRGVQPDRPRLEERHHPTVRADGLAHVDRADLAVPQDIGRHIDIALDAERPRDVHDPPEGQDAQGGLRSEQVLGDEVDGPIPTGRDDDVDAVGDSLTDDRAGGRLIGGLVDLGRDPVAFEDLAEVGDAATRPEGGRQTGGSGSR